MHVSIYVALGLAFFHQIHIGVMFITSPVARWLWIVIWLSVVASILSFRVALPIWRNLRHQLRVRLGRARWHPTCTRSLSRGVCSRDSPCRAASSSNGDFSLPVSGGTHTPTPSRRFPDRRTCASPSRDSAIRAARLLASRPGTRVIVEGPYGTFTRHRLMASRVVLIGAGVGVTPLRALLEDLPLSTAVTVGRSRARAPRTWSTAENSRNSSRAARATTTNSSGHVTRCDLTLERLRGLVGNLHDADVYVCGPSDFTEQSSTTATRLGARPDRLHFETFSF